MAAHLQLLRKDEHTQAHRHTSSVVYHVAEGGGYSIIAGKRFDWVEGDTFVVPSWAWHEHASAGRGGAVLVHGPPGDRGVRVLPRGQPTRPAARSDGFGFG